MDRIFTKLTSHTNNEHLESWDLLTSGSLASGLIHSTNCFVNINSDFHIFRILYKNTSLFMLFASLNNIVELNRSISKLFPGVCIIVIFSLELGILKEMFC